jgi:transposase-like protein
VERARDESVELVGPGGLLSGLTKNVLEASLEAEMSEHLGYDKHDRAGREKGSNSRSGTRSKEVLTDVGPVEIDVPRDRDGTCEPQIVKKRQRRLSGVDEMVISLTAKGPTTGELQAHMAEVYGADVSRDTVSTPRPNLTHRYVRRALGGLLVRGVRGKASFQMVPMRQKTRAQSAPIAAAHIECSGGSYSR